MAALGGWGPGSRRFRGAPREWLDATWSREPSVCTRAALARRYGTEAAARVRHAEAFQICPNTAGSRQPKSWMRCFHVDDMSKMLQETRDQPEALSRTLSGGIAGAEELRRNFGKRRPRLIVLVARGTSDNAAQFGRYLIEITTRIPVSLAAPSILTLYGCPVDLRRRGGDRDFAIGRIHRHQRGAGGCAQTGRDDHRNYERRGQRDGRILSNFRC